MIFTENQLTFTAFLISYKKNVALKATDKEWKEYV